MSEPALLLTLLTFAVIGLLPRIFFQKTDGKFGLGWWVTALPFFLGPALLITAYVTGLGPITPTGWTRWLQLATVVFAAASISLIFMTLGTHRIPIALFHQQNDAPQHIVTYGAYGRIRHPFYAAFLLVFLAALALFPHWGTLALLAYTAGGLTITARREEQRLSASEFGGEYQQYMTRTGRFFPRLLPVRAAEPAVGGRA
jgi:protein-S-isoprenylcysteine O-methyltransferase Ste14